MIKNVLNATRTTLFAALLGACGVEYRTAPAPCVQVDHISYDAPGRDNQNLNGEYAVFVNSCVEPVNVGGWSVEDEQLNHYDFPSRTLLPDQEVCLRSGSGVDNAHNLYWRSSGRPIWNNDKDTLRLFDDLGRLVLEYNYDNR